MRKNRTRPLLGWILLLLGMILIVAALLGLEYLGRAQPQHMIDQLIVSPESAATSGVNTGNAGADGTKTESAKTGSTKTDSADTANIEAAQ